jgi:hypothetical protein
MNYFVSKEDYFVNYGAKQVLYAQALTGPSGRSTLSIDLVGSSPDFAA